MFGGPFLSTGPLEKLGLASDAPGALLHAARAYSFSSDISVIYQLFWALSRTSSERMTGHSQQ